MLVFELIQPSNIFLYFLTRVIQKSRFDRIDKTLLLVFIMKFSESRARLVPCKINTSILWRHICHALVGAQLFVNIICQLGTGKTALKLLNVINKIWNSFSFDIEIYETRSQTLLTSPEARLIIVCKTRFINLNIKWKLG